MDARMLSALIPFASARAPRIGLVDRLHEFAALRRQRRSLTTLPDHLLDDIGLTRETAQYEAQRPVWDAPRHWRR